ncbi:response regulator [Flavobacterium sp.]|uniref:response regulator n=1 Tax=Flavobacterium sp. TaxID=239 RepID=UPI0037516DBB
MSKLINLAIIDDHPIVIEGFSILLADSNKFKIVASFNKGLEILEYEGINNIDVLLLDVFLPDINGIDLCKIIKHKFPNMIVLGMSSQSERTLVMQFIQNGANGYLLKTAPLKEFYDCIEKAILGEIVFSSEVKAIISKPDISDFKKLPSPTKREKEILLLIAAGKSTKEIAELLFLSSLTVQNHRKNMFNKFEVKNVAQLLNIAQKNRLL